MPRVVTVSAALSSVTASVSTLPNDGTSLSVITVTAINTDGNPMAGLVAARFSVTSTGTSNTITALDAATNQAGEIRYSFASTNAQAKTISASILSAAVTDTAAITVTGAEDYSLRAPEVGDFYLDPAAGSDGTGTEASPWNVFTNAKLSTLTAGKILWIKDGTFDWATLSTLASGTEGSRIKIAAYPTHAPVATLSSSTVGFDSCYGFGATSGSADYWDIVGITFNLAGRAGIMFGASQWNNAELTCSHVRIIDCIGNTTLAASDNGGILFFDDNADNVQVIRGVYTATGASGGSGTNRALIWADYQRYIKVIGVDLNAAGTSLPFYYKHTNLQTSDEVSRVFKNNIVRGGSRGTLFCGKFFQVSNNVFDGALVDFGDQGGGDAGRGENLLQHNTFRNATVGFTGSGSGLNYDNVLIDNVITGTGELWDNPYASTDIRTVSSYNAYDSGAAEIRRNSTTYSLSGYKTAFADREISSVAGTITFDGAVPSSTPAHWLLAAGSNGENDASDGTDCGVNTTNLLTVN
jgi:hypothetical protein